MPRQTAAQKRTDLEIERLYRIHAAGRQINILKIGAVFAAGYDAIAAGQPLEPAIVAAVQLHTEPATPPARMITYADSWSESGDADGGL